jgi:uncharacterized membrane protein
MIKNFFGIACVLLLIESAVLYVSSRSRFKKYFRFIPAVFWIYFLPMLAAGFGLIDPHNEVYPFASANLLPAALILLLLSSEISSILRLGKPALVMMLAGSLGIMIGMPLVFSFFRPWVGADMWSGFGALSGSWVGGSANMIAVKEAIGTPDAVFMPMVVVDTIVPYVWMAILICGAALQAGYDKWNRSDCRVLTELNARMQGIQVKDSRKFSLAAFLAMIATVFLGVVICRAAASRLPVVREVISNYTWIIITSSLAGIFLSFTPARRLEAYGASRVGYFILYFVLTAIGSRASIADLNTTLLLVIAGFLVVFFLAGVLVLTGRLIKAPMFLIGAASQANIGGVASAPVVAEVYQRGLASVGLLMAIMGNIIGTYLGIITGQLCRWVAR